MAGLQSRNIPPLATVRPSVRPFFLYPPVHPSCTDAFACRGTRTDVCASCRTCHRKSVRRAHKADVAVRERVVAATGPRPFNRYKSAIVKAQIGKFIVVNISSRGGRVLRLFNTLHALSPIYENHDDANTRRRGPPLDRREL